MADSAVLGWSLLTGLCSRTTAERLPANLGRAAFDRCTADGGNVSSTFVGADGNGERTVETGANGATMNAIVIVQAERGELRLELLNPDGNVAFSVQARPDEQVTRRGDVLTTSRAACATV